MSGCPLAHPRASGKSQFFSELLEKCSLYLHYFKINLGIKNKSEFFFKGELLYSSWSSFLLQLIFSKDMLVIDLLFLISPK